MTPPTAAARVALEPGIDQSGVQDPSTCDGELFDHVEDIGFTGEPMTNRTDAVLER